MKNLISKIGLGLTIFAVQTVTFAGRYGIDQNVAITGATQGNLQTSVMGFVNYFLGFLGIIAVIMIIYNGLQMVTGGSEAQEGSKKNIIALVIGLIIITLSYSIVSLISDAPVT